MSPFNRHAPARRQMTAAGNDCYIVRSEPTDLFVFDFQSGGPFPEARATVKLRSSGGRVDGVAQWAPLHLDEFTSFENAPPMSPTKAMGAIFHPFIRPIETVPREDLTVHGSHDRQNLRIWAEAHS